MLDAHGNHKAGSKYQVDKSTNYLKIEAKKKPTNITNPIETFRKQKIIINNGVFPLNPKENAHFTDLMRDSKRLNIESRNSKNKK